MNQTMQDEFALEEPSPRERIARLEERIEELTIKLEGCQKFALAARLAVVFGGVLLAAGLFSVLRLDAVTMTAAAAAVLGGIVMSGSNRSTAREIEAQLAAAEAERAGLIGQIDLQVVGGRDLMH
jgi:hypothetical protein